MRSSCERIVVRCNHAQLQPVAISSGRRLPSTVSPRGPPRDRPDRCQRSRRPHRREPRRPAHGAAARRPARDRLGPHRGDHRHHEHDRGGRDGRCGPRRAAPRRLRSQPRPRRRARAPRPRCRARWRDASHRRSPDARPSAGRGSCRARPMRSGWARSTRSAMARSSSPSGLAAIAFGALLPEWLDPLMGRIVGFTLVALGLWVMYSIYRYARAGERFRLRSRWMIVFDVDALWLAPVPGAPPRPRARRAARDELVRRADLVRGRDDPRDRRRDRDPGPADRRGRWRVERRASASRCCSPS